MITFETFSDFGRHTVMLIVDGNAFRIRFEGKKDIVFLSRYNWGCGPCNILPVRDPFLIMDCLWNCFKIEKFYGSKKIGFLIIDFYNGINHWKCFFSLRILKSIFFIVLYYRENYLCMIFFDVFILCIDLCGFEGVYFFVVEFYGCQIVSVNIAEIFSSCCWI